MSEQITLAREAFGKGKITFAQYHNILSKIFNKY